MNTDTPPAKPQHNKLALPEQIKVLDWCRQNEEKVKTLPDTALAQIAEAELGFKITVPNLTSVRQAAGIEKLKPTAPLTVEERLERLEKMQKVVQSLVEIITGNALSGRLGLTVNESKLLGLITDPAPQSPPLPAPDSPETLPGLEPAN